VHKSMLPRKIFTLSISPCSAPCPCQSTLLKANSLTISTGLQVTYRSAENFDVSVVKHGLTNGSPIIMADVPFGQTLNQVVGWSTDKINYLSFRTNNGTNLNVAGKLDGMINYQLDQPIFGCYGGTKDGVLVSLGFYVLAGPFSQSALHGGRTTSVNNPVLWDDSGRYNGNRPWPATWVPGT
jgi:hypothetical protein